MENLKGCLNAKLLLIGFMCEILNYELEIQKIGICEYRLLLIIHKSIDPSLWKSSKIYDN